MKDLWIRKYTELGLHPPLTGGHERYYLSKTETGINVVAHPPSGEDYIGGPFLTHADAFAWQSKESKKKFRTDSAIICFSVLVLLGLFCVL